MTIKLMTGEFNGKLLTVYQCQSKNLYVRKNKIFQISIVLKNFKTIKLNSRLLHFSKFELSSRFCLIHS